MDQDQELESDYSVSEIHLYDNSFDYKSNLEQESFQNCTTIDEIQPLDIKTFDTPRIKIPKIENIINEFIRMIQNKAPKRENFRMKLIRGYKKIIRHIQKKESPPEKTFIKCTKKLETKFNRLKNFVTRNKAELSNVCNTSSGPKNDYKYTKKRYSAESTSEKTYNNSYCASLFLNPIYKEGYLLFIDYLFDESQTPDELSQKFSFSCCDVKKKCFCCIKKWARLKEYCKGNLVDTHCCNQESI